MRHLQAEPCTMCVKYMTEVHFISLKCIMCHSLLTCVIHLTAAEARLYAQEPAFF